MRGTYHQILVLLVLAGCSGPGGSPTAGPTPSATSLGGQAILVRTLHPEPALIGLWNPRERSGWRGPGPWSISPSMIEGTYLRLQVIPIELHWSSLTLPLFTTPLPSELILLPRMSLPESIYAEELDLLTEFVAPFDGGIVRRWIPERLRVARPLPVAGVDYLGTLERAVQIWNQSLGRMQLELVAYGEEAEVICEVTEESRLGYARRLDQDETGHPTLMLIHLSPRWAIGAERFVQRAWLHELGHVMGLWGHSRDPRHIMHGSYLAVDAPNPEECTALAWLWELPHASHLGWYRRPNSSSSAVQDRQPHEDQNAELEPGITRPRDARAAETVACHPALH